MIEAGHMLKDVSMMDRLDLEQGGRRRCLITVLSAKERSSPRFLEPGDSSE